MNCLGGLLCAAHRGVVCRSSVASLLLVAFMSVPTVAQDNIGDYADHIIGDFEFNGNADDSSGRDAAIELKNTAFTLHNLYLDGGSRETDKAYVAQVTTPALNFDEFTVAMRFQGRTYQEKSNHILSAGAGEAWFGLSRSENGKLLVTLNDGKFKYEVENATLSDLNNYALICGVSIPESKVRVYMNGTIVGETDLPQGFKLNVGAKDKVWSFANSKSGVSFDGWVDDLIIYDRMLNADEMADIPLRYNDNLTEGENALQENTTGVTNTAVGVNALQFNTTGDYNTAMGAWALRKNTTGQQNTGVGTESLKNNATGSYNSAFGRFSLASNETGNSNTAVGAYALDKNTTGSWNTAVGTETLRNNTVGEYNSSFGFWSLQENLTGKSNTASGAYALQKNTSGSWNAAYGLQALINNTTGNSNTAIGTESLKNNTEGSNNIVIGTMAGELLTTGSHNIVIAHKGVAEEEKTIRIGSSENQTRAFLAGVVGVTTGANDAVPVMIDSTGQLGTVSSSRRFKEDIHDLSEAETQERLQNLRPVTFRYKKAFNDGERPVQFGLIAEEVAAVFPELVVFNQDGQPETVKYHLLTPLLLQQVQEQQAQLQQKEQQLQQLEQRLQKLEAVLGRGE